MPAKRFLHAARLQPRRMRMAPAPSGRSVGLEGSTSSRASRHAALARRRCAATGYRALAAGFDDAHNAGVLRGSAINKG